jgi:hypothetical protein
MSLEECHYAECRYAEGHYAECHYAECHYAECRYDDSRYDECHYAECRGALAWVIRRDAGSKITVFLPTVSSAGSFIDATRNNFRAWSRTGVDEINITG